MCSWASGCFPAPAQAFSIFNPGLVYAVCLSWLHIIITTAYVRLSLTASVRITVAVSIISTHHQVSMYCRVAGAVRRPHADARRARAAPFGNLTAYIGCRMSRACTRARPSRASAPGGRRCPGVRPACSGSRWGPAGGARGARLGWDARTAGRKIFMGCFDGLMLRLLIACGRGLAAQDPDQYLGGARPPGASTYIQGGIGYGRHALRFHRSRADLPLESLPDSGIPDPSVPARGARAQRRWRGGAAPAGLGSAQAAGSFRNGDGRPRVRGENSSGVERVARTHTRPRGYIQGGADRSGARARASMAGRVTGAAAGGRAGGRGWVCCARWRERPGGKAILSGPAGAGLARCGRRSAAERRRGRARRDWWKAG